jgi:hypothetical protein
MIFRDRYSFHSILLSHFDGWRSGFGVAAFHLTATMAASDLWTSPAFYVLEGWVAGERRKIGKSIFIFLIYPNEPNDDDGTSKKTHSDSLFFNSSVVVRGNWMKGR